MTSNRFYFLFFLFFPSTGGNVRCDKIIPTVLLKSARPLGCRVVLDNVRQTSRKDCFDSDCKSILVD